jgi:hypothetical protein
MRLIIPSIFTFSVSVAALFVYADHPDPTVKALIGVAAILGMVVGVLGLLTWVQMGERQVSGRNWQ